MNRAVRRAQLMHCAQQACARHGIARVTHSHIASAAAVSVPTVYAYFPTREDLVEQLVQEVETFLSSLVFDTLAGKGSVTEQFTYVAQAFAQAARDEPDLLKVWLDWSTGVESPLWPQYLAVLERLHKAYSRAIRRGQGSGELAKTIDPMSASRLFAGGGHTIVLMTFAGASRAQIGRFIEQLVTGALTGH